METGTYLFLYAKLQLSYLLAQNVNVLSKIKKYSFVFRSDMRMQRNDNQLM